MKSASKNIEIADETLKLSIQKNSADLRSKQHEELYEALKRLGDKDSATVRLVGATVASLIVSRDDDIDQGMAEVVINSIISTIQTEKERAVLDNILVGLRRLASKRINEHLGGQLIIPRVHELKKRYRRDLQEAMTKYSLLRRWDLRKPDEMRIAVMEIGPQTRLPPSLVQRMFKKIAMGPSWVYPELSEAQNSLEGQSSAIAAKLIAEVQVCGLRLHVSGNIIADCLRILNKLTLDAGSNDSVEINILDPVGEIMGRMPVSLEEGYFAAMDLRGLNLCGASLASSDLQQTRFDFSNCEKVDFSFADLTGSSFVSTRINGASFNSAILTDASFNDSNFEDAEFKDSNWWEANFDTGPDSFDSNKIDAMFEKYSAAIPTGVRRLTRRASASGAYIVSKLNLRSGAS